MKKAIKIIGLILLGVIFIGTFVFLYNKTQKKEATFEEIAPAYNDLQRTTVATGTIEPRNEVDIKPQISGIVAELYKEAGQSVKKGELIARVKVIPDMSSLNSAENRVRLAQLNLAQAQRDYNSTISSSFLPKRWRNRTWRFVKTKKNWRMQQRHCRFLKKV